MDTQQPQNSTDEGQSQQPEPPRYANFTRPTPPRRNGWDVYRAWCDDNEADWREMAKWER